MGVPEIVEPDGRDLGVADDPTEGLVEGVRVDHLAVAVGEDPLLVVGDANGRELGGLESAPPCENRKGGVVECDGAPCGLGLASGLVDFVADGDEATVEVQPLLLEVDVGLLESEDLVAAHAGHGGEPHDREEPVPGCGAQEQAELVFGPGLALDPLQRSLLGGMRDDRDVASHEPATVRVGERTADHEVDLVDGLGRQPSPGSRVEERVVQGFDLLVAQPPDPGPSECGEDVALHFALVAPVGARR